MPASSASRSAAAGILGRIAQETGGETLGVDATGSLGVTFRRALDNFRSSYVLFYSPAGVERGGFHTIAVTVSRQNMVVQARRGYFGG